MNKIVKNLTNGLLKLKTSEGIFYLKKGETKELYYRTKIENDKSQWEVIQIGENGGGEGGGSCDCEGIDYTIVEEDID